MILIELEKLIEKRHFITGQGMGMSRYKMTFSINFSSSSWKK